MGKILAKTQHQYHHLPPHSTEKFTITFDATTIECKKGEKGAEGNVTSGAEAKEGKHYRFIAKFNKDEIVEHWYVNGNKNVH
ncbi:MAG: hypothetical protein ACTTKH_01210 [Treponema sp.]